MAVTVLEVLIEATAPMTHAQIASRVHGTPVRPIGDAEEDRRRSSAIRSVQTDIGELRRRYLPVIPTGRGMWLARTPQEALEAARNLRSRAIHQIETAQALERAAERMADPLTLWSDAA